MYSINYKRFYTIIGSLYSKRSVQKLRFQLNAFLGLFMSRFNPIVRAKACGKQVYSK